MAKDPRRDLLMQNLTAKYGTGIAAKADTSGNHMMAQTVIDAYAQQGKAIPAGLQQKLRLMNEITQSEAVLATASPDARIARMSSGYDPVGTARQMAQLEMEVMQESAEARNYADLLANRTSEENVRALELANRLNTETQDAQIEATRAQFELVALQARTNKQPLEIGLAAKGILNSPGVAGKTTDELLQIWAANDPNQLQATFGTTDRVNIHGAIRMYQQMNDEATQGQIDGMTKAANMQATMLASDPAVTDDMLMGMASGQLPAEINGTKLSLLAVKNALAERTAVQTAKAAYVNARTSGLQDAEKLQALGLEGLRMDQMAGAVGALVGVPPEQVLRALETGQVIALADALYSTPEIAQNGGQLTIAGPDGQPMQVSAQAFIEKLSDKYDAKALETATTLSNSLVLDRYMTDLKESERQVQAVANIIGRPLPEAAMARIGMLRDEARANITAAMRATDPKIKTALLDKAMEAEQVMRDQLAIEAQKLGAPSYVVEDVKMGRFSSEKSLHAAQVDLFGFGGAGTENSIFGLQIQELLASKQITPVEFEAFVKADPTAPTPEGEINPASVEALGITKQDIVQIVEGTAWQETAAATGDFIAKDPGMAQLDPEFRAQLQPLLDGTLAKELSLTPAENMNRMIAVLRVADEAAWSRGELVAAQGGPANTYQRGTMLKRLVDYLNYNKPIETVLQGTGSWADQALLAMYYSAKTGKTADTGPNAIAFADQATVVGQLVQRQMAATITGRSSTEINSLRLRVSGDVDRFTSQARGTPLSQIPGNLAERDPQRRAAIEAAIYNAYVKQIAAPEKYNTVLQNWWRPNEPGAPGDGYSLVSDAAIRRELTAMGLNPDDFILAGK